VNLLQELISQAPAAALAIVGIYLFMTGRIHSDIEFKKLEKENQELKQALAAERTAVNEAASTGSVTNQLVGALVTLAAERKGIDPPPVKKSSVDLTGEDLGL
jgi:hypothetical protein